jgi:hypothetical protein
LSLPTLLHGEGTFALRSLCFALINLFKSPLCLSSNSFSDKTKNLVSRCGDLNLVTGTVLQLEMGSLLSNALFAGGMGDEGVVWLRENPVHGEQPVQSLKQRPKSKEAGARGG